MQRYFLIFSIIFLSYLLLINYNPPQEESISDSVLNDSEYSQLIQEEAFVSRDDIIEDEVFLLEETCSTNNLFLISNDVWKIKIDLPSGKISYLELTDYPKPLAQVRTNCF